MTNFQSFNFAHDDKLTNFLQQIRFHQVHKYIEMLAIDCAPTFDLQMHNSEELPILPHYRSP